MYRSFATSDDARAAHRPGDTSAHDGASPPDRFCAYWSAASALPAPMAVEPVMLVMVATFATQYVSVATGRLPSAPCVESVTLNTSFSENGSSEEFADCAAHSFVAWRLAM